MKHLSVLDILLFPPFPYSQTIETSIYKRILPPTSDFYPKQVRYVYFPWKLRTFEAEESENERRHIHILQRTSSIRMLYSLKEARKGHLGGSAS